MPCLTPGALPVCYRENIEVKAGEGCKRHCSTPHIAVFYAAYSFKATPHSELYGNKATKHHFVFPFCVIRIFCIVNGRFVYKNPEA